MQHWRKFQAALIFYTCLPLHPQGTLNFRGIALYAPLIGIFIGVVIAAFDLCLGLLKPASEFIYLRSLLTILLGLLITGGLHLDGAMDTADGLAVTDPHRRLEVMADSNTGAFGAIAGITILLLKVIALAAIKDQRVWVLTSVWAWARWGQLRAIMAYPYLKAIGKGKFHQEDLHHWQVRLVAILLMAGNCAVAYFNKSLYLGIGLTVIGFSFAWLIGAWLNRQLSGQTGDTYGAIVEWTEALSLVAIAYL
ncbi:MULTISPECIES: adenosylcobinamide-GDP ribazoletransferase [Pseudanabaena]|jgi:adenosylcobinamide-GDP ribazoletransferase|uniref:adenosylcobinamide-GDP ribazoletransferase n=1 Tax=Pseudanabaena TaxID=1152 RepID=UPI00247A6334|nr:MULTISPECIES: adenosylcobinamide-GDP ribazoletransferase [Pseudanabaena]MEA5489258.1 adenosylcobinamide-GDP ribazoletransferase [Pseudanabaena sp. CCNP1317]WGS73491.1 adenosylcobinamide-GDP ribazoletransferase [Pseudanabaena galeata CCNP1313]